MTESQTYSIAYTLMLSVVLIEHSSRVLMSELRTILAGPVPGNPDSKYSQTRLNIQWILLQFCLAS